MKGDICKVNGCNKIVTRQTRTCNSCASAKHDGRKYPVDNWQTKPLEERFWLKVEKTKDGCWNWGGALTGAGYGALQNKNKYISAHRFSFELHKEMKIPDDMCICHSCDNPACVNPGHLFLGTHGDNMTDKTAKGRAKGAHVGDKHPLAKLNCLQVTRIKELLNSGEKQTVIADYYGVSMSTINDIKKERYWEHVK